MSQGRMYFTLKMRVAKYTEVKDQVIFKEANDLTTDARKDEDRRTDKK
jgi:hypothetical protein